MLPRVSVSPGDKITSFPDSIRLIVIIGACGLAWSGVFKMNPQELCTKVLHIRPFKNNLKFRRHSTRRVLKDYIACLRWKLKRTFRVWVLRRFFSNYSMVIFSISKIIRRFHLKNGNRSVRMWVLVCANQDISSVLHNRYSSSFHAGSCVVFYQNRVILSLIRTRVFRSLTLAHRFNDKVPVHVCPAGDCLKGDNPYSSQPIVQHKHVRVCGHAYLTRTGDVRACVRAGIGM